MDAHTLLNTSFALLIGLLLGGLLVYWRSRLTTQRLTVELAIAQTALKSQTQLNEERQAAFTLSAAQMAQQFDQVAGRSLRENSELFLKLAREHLGQHQQAAASHLGEREQAIEKMVSPIREALLKTEQQIARIEKERAESFGALRTSIESVTLSQQLLHKETRNLVTALRRPEVRGQWGELTLKRLAELAGMVEHCDFNEQVHTTSDTGNIRPDMLIHLPDDRLLVVDVKTPLDAYLEAIEASSDEARGAALQRHARGVAERVRQLAAKNYWAQFEHSPDFVILFIPGEQFLSAALAENPALLENAIQQNVIITTPTSFIALLKAVAYGWRQAALAKNAQIIRDLACELYKRLSNLTGHWVKLGRTLNQSVEAFNSAVGSLERQVLPSARKFTELGVRSDKTVEHIELIEALTRAPQDTPATADTELQELTP